MKPSGGLIGILTAVAVFLAIGVPLIESGVDFWLSIVISMVVLVVALLLVDKVHDWFSKDKEEQQK